MVCISRKSEREGGGGLWGLVLDGGSGGSIFDGFLLAASQEVGQVILTLPYTFSLVGECVVECVVECVLECVVECVVVIIGL